MRSQISEFGPMDVLPLALSMPDKILIRTVAVVVIARGRLDLLIATLSCR